MTKRRRKKAWTKLANKQKLRTAERVAVIREAPMLYLTWTAIIPEIQETINWVKRTYG